MQKPETADLLFSEVVFNEILKFGAAVTVRLKKKGAPPERRRVE